MIKNMWYGILPSRFVKQDQIVAVKRLGMDLCFFRNEKKEIGCVMDKCTHRGAQISKGKHHGNSVACPFHGIRFDKDGKCVLIPANGRASEVEKRFNVQSFLVKEANDMIYLWYGDKEKATDKPPFFEEYIDDSYVFSEMQDLWHAHYSRCIENQLDVIHLPFVHYNTIGRGHKTIVNGPPVEFKDNTITVTAYNSVDTGQKPKPASDYKISDKLNIRFKFPNVWQNHITDDIKVIIFFVPVDEERTMFYIRFYTNKFKIKLLDDIMASVGKVMNRVIEKQDKQYVETQKPKASSYHSNEHLLKGDSPVILYRKLREEFQNENED